MKAREGGGGEGRPGRGLSKGTGSKKGIQGEGSGVFDYLGPN